MYKLLIILLFCASCATNRGGDAVANQNPDDTTNTEFKLTVPSKNLVSKELNKKRVNLGSKGNLNFDFYIAQGHYWVTVSTLDGTDLIPESEVTLNIKQGDRAPESISLVKISEDTFNGIGNGLSGSVNIELIFKIPRKKSLVFNFDIEV